MKLTRHRQLVISLTAFLFLSFFSMNCLATDIPISNPGTPPQPGQPRAPFRIPLTASYTTEEVNLNFIYSVGIATIAISDEFGAIVYQVTIDTSVQPILYIPVDMWDSGNYLITIQYGSIKLKGQFSL